MKLKEKILWIAVVLAVVFYLVPRVKERFAFAGSDPALHQTAPGFSLTDLNGKKVSLADFKGKLVLVNFFASWCPPCKMEIPGFEKAYTEYKDRGFTIIGIAVDGVRPSFISTMGMTYPVVNADDGVLRNYGNISSIPVSFLVGRDGRIIKKVMGMYFESSMKSDIEKALSNRS